MKYSDQKDTRNFQKPCAAEKAMTLRAKLYTIFNVIVAK